MSGMIPSLSRFLGSAYSLLHSKTYCPKSLFLRNRSDVSRSSNSTMLIITLFLNKFLIIKLINKIINLINVDLEYSATEKVIKSYKKL